LITGRVVAATFQGTALLTGASAGLGRALAREFASNGHHVVLVARREEKLRDVCGRLADEHGVVADYVVQDLSTRDGRESLYESVTGRDVDYLVNNVGIGTQGHFLETELERELDQVQLNVATPVHLTKLFGPGIRDGGGGGVLNVASTAAFQPGPYIAGYYASESYLLSLSEALHEEFADDGIAVTALCPGPVDTEFQERAGNTDTALGREGAGAIRWQDAEDLSRAGYEGLMAGRAVVVPGLDYKLLERLTPVTPRPLRRRLAAKLNR
jgi:short-subunit dehydrogenase